MTTLFANVNGVDAAAKRVLLDDGDAVPYDTLVLATGARHAYFGHDEWEPFAPGLKTLEDATTLRRRILVAFERAERETDPARRAALLTFVIIGAGPTGVEMAGTIADLAKDTLPPDFRNIDTHKTRVVLIEAGPRVLARLSRGPLRLRAAVAGGDRRRGGAGAAGHRMCRRWRRLWRQPAGGQNHRLGRRRARFACRGMAERARRPGHRLKVEPDLTVPGHPDVFAVGDTVTIAGPDGNPVPGIAPAAKQQGRYVAALIKARLNGSKLPPFRYKHAGNLAQIGKTQGRDRFRLDQAARHPRLVDLGHRPHLLPDRLRNRLSVALSWLWIHARDQRAARLITQGREQGHGMSLRTGRIS